MKKENLIAFHKADNGWAKGPYHFADPVPGFFLKNLGPTVGTVLLVAQRPLGRNMWTLVVQDCKIRKDFTAKTAEDAVREGLKILSDTVSDRKRALDEEVEQELKNLILERGEY